MHSAVTRIAPASGDVETQEDRRGLALRPIGPKRGKKRQKGFANRQDWRMIKEVLRAEVRPATLSRYLERRRRRSTRTVIVTVITSAVITVTPMTTNIGASFPPKRWITGPGGYPGPARLGRRKNVPYDPHAGGNRKLTRGSLGAYINDGDGLACANSGEPAVIPLS